MSGLGAQIDLIVTDELTNADGKHPPDHDAIAICTESGGTVRKACDIYQEMINILSEEETSMEVMDNRIDQAVCPSE